MYFQTHFSPAQGPWNKGKLIGQKRPLKLQQIWAIRIRLQLDRRVRDLALSNLAIDSKLRGCDLVSLRVGDVAPGGIVANRAEANCSRLAWNDRFRPIAVIGLFLIPRYKRSAIDPDPSPDTLDVRRLMSS